MTAYIADNISHIQSQIPPHVQMVAVSKMHLLPKLQEAYDAGQRAFGENKVQEMQSKQPLMPTDVQWHQLGHLQTNKVKYIAPYVHLIHSVDSLKLLQSINQEGERNERVIDCLLQIHIAHEDTKYGFSTAECLQLLEGTDVSTLRHIRLSGLMGMATYSSDVAVVRSEFRELYALFHRLQPQFSTFHTLSMGMTHDYHIAIDEGSNMIRIGSGIFGVRPPLHKA